MMLEALDHADNAFVTLTYDEDHVPTDGSLRPGDLQGWLKRFRKAIEPRRVRYYAVGEYGEQTGRPHYHVALFGWPGCADGATRYGRYKYSCCEFCRTIHGSWNVGDIVSGELNAKSMQYVCGYVVKKMTKADDPRLGGRHPEFARMSLRPGIGYGALHKVAAELLRYNMIEAQGDVPSALRHGQKLWPTGRYLKRHLRLMCGESENAPAEVVAKARQELSVLYESVKGKEMVRERFREEVAKSLEQKVLQVEARSKIYKQRRSQ